MKYENVFEGVFVKRPNRFIAIATIDGKEEVCHVKNTGRCKELLIEGTKVFLQKSDNPSRKTNYDLIAVCKENNFINIDSQAPNKVFYEWVKSSGYFDNITMIKPECRYKNSRFDFYIETNDKKIFVEVKGVTLEEEGLAKFPDAPTERGIKHIKELAECIKEGYEAYIFFIVQIPGIKHFTPNAEMHPEFADELIKAEQLGVNVKAVNCNVLPDTLEINDFVKVSYENIKK